MILTPDYDLTVAGSSIRSRFEGRAISISVTDQAGTSSDTLDLAIEAGDFAVEIPRKGAVIAVSLGYRETGLIPMGLYIADTPEITMPPVQISVSAKSADMRASLKEHRTGSWEGRTLGDILGDLARRNGLVPMLSQALASRKIPFFAQTEESDLNLLTRLGRLHGAVAAPKNGKLVFAPRGQGQSASGKNLPRILLTPSQVSQCSFRLPDRPQVKEVRSHWFDRAHAKRQMKTAPSGGEQSSFTLRHDFPTEDEARWAGESKASELRAAAGSFSATLPGNPLLGAETIVTTTGFYPGTDGAFVVKTATHALDAGTFTTQIECEMMA